MRMILALLALVAAAGVLYKSAQAARDRKTPAGTARALPVDVRAAGGAWFWLEQPDGPHARLVRAHEGTAAALATADAITGYDVSGNTIAWTQRDGTVWSIRTADADGKPRIVWTGPEEVDGPHIAGGQVFWAQRSPAPVAGDLPVPALGPTVQIQAADPAGGPVRPVCSLLEQAAQVVGAAGGQLYVAALRASGTRQTALYTVPAAGGTARRVAGETGESIVLPRPDGTVCWVAESRDASNRLRVSCVRELQRDGSIRTLSDWMPSGGSLFESGGTVYYLDGDSPQSLWPIQADGGLPSPHHVQRGYALRGVADGKALLQPYGLGGGPLYEASIP